MAGLPAWLAAGGTLDTAVPAIQANPGASRAHSAAWSSTADVAALLAARHASR